MRHALLVRAALQSLSGEIFPHLSAEGEKGLAETALCLQAVADVPLSSAPGVRARVIWRNGRMAWALGAPRIAFGRYAEARAVFLGASTDTAGLFEAASLSLDMLEVLLRLGDRKQLQELALEAATTFNALGVDPACLGPRVCSTARDPRGGGRVRLGACKSLPGARGEAAPPPVGRRRECSLGAAPPLPSGSGHGGSSTRRSAGLSRLESIWSGF